MSRGHEPHRAPGTAVERLKTKALASEANAKRDIETNNVAAAQESLSARVPPSWGGPLNESDYILLESSWITRDLADAAMLRRVDALEGREIVGRKGKMDCSGILIPYFWPDEPRAFNYRLRRDNPDRKVDKDGKPKADQKYLGAPGSIPPIGFTFRLASPRNSFSMQHYQS